jgi:hypothetical protein
MHRKPPPAATTLAPRSKEPPPERNTTPVGKPLTVLFKSNATRRCPGATSGATDDLAGAELVPAGDADKTTGVGDGLDGEYDLPQPTMSDVARRTTAECFNIPVPFPII